MEKFVIEGGVPLSGTVTPAGNKNAALPLLAACLLTDEDVTLYNVPAIRDTEALLELLVDLGVTVERPDLNTVKLNAANVNKTEVDADLAERIRASFLAAGPLLARFGSATMPPPGGDVIGRRRLDPHLDAFRALGATVEHGRDVVIKAPAEGLAPCDFFMDEPSVMGTENALMAAAGVAGTTVIRNAACEPHVQDVARMLNKMGAAIEGIGSNVMTVHGVATLGGCEYSVSPDHIEIGSFMALAGVTGGELDIKGCVADDLRMVRLAFRRLGLESEMREDGTCHIPGNQTLKVARDAGDYQSKIEDGPWPAFPADLTSIAVALATQAEGSVLIFEKMFENRLFFVDKLISMGAEITICDPHRAIVIGPRQLRGARVSSPDIRAGMAMLIAAVCAQGTSEIHNVRDIDRGYERIDERLRALGANIERVPVT
ncbi:UDP-N-acetylglucosamine 1-carboxyvinyltransferase [Solirubrobacter sp. CPCC 204708]|uniref:UDP-N-acetylglucosamine 1-carboxyvinyltransferase n=1 Tax=Solirubrobacter deserti TaxID=2282478 RepID=A0ABT4RSM3_9ACTN|nr:UDP-N-acetylglucosamine 1-carboxyvinyltransferase [Solirubrobacter deserti]MBE2315090.1 UDP-N-acetylglucosamine 1-carboxyvinyltransferase [Solirubrobacter deserti]MDA0141388.1 UDP-N-acetylglucosamine 1-carboxyvinyltransferase [Solirubrobacter deserti]